LEKFPKYGGEILNLQILQRPSSINSPEQTLRMLSPAAATDPTETPEFEASGPETDLFVTLFIGSCCKTLGFETPA
jgi:hypothetical protein